jgi:hypothetical protein
MHCKYCRAKTDSPSMKLIKGCLIAITFVCAISAVHAGDEKGLPPGLQKKDKLPPGWEKKQHSAQATTNAPAVATPAAPAAAPTSVPAAPTTANPAPAVAATPAVAAPVKTPAPAPTPRPPKEVKAEMNNRIESVNKLDNKTAARKAGMEAAAKETGVPLSKLQAQRKEHPDVGIGSLVMANSIAAQTKKKPGQLLENHQAGKSWAEIAKDNNVDMEALDAKLGRVEQSMKNAK